MGLGNGDNNYQYVLAQNTTGQTARYDIELWMTNWEGMGSDTWGIAWSTV